MLSTSKLYAVRRANLAPWPVEWPEVSKLTGFFTGKTHKLPLGAGTLYEDIQRQHRAMDCQSLHCVREERKQA